MIMTDENDEFKIFKDEYNSKYKIEFNEPSISLINSIIYCKILPGLTVEPDYRTIHFKATSLKILSNLKNQRIKSQTNLGDCDAILKLCYYLSFQLKYTIIKQNKCFINYDINKIIIIDKNKFFYLSNKSLFSIDTLTEPKEYIQITNSFKKTEFTSPELMEIMNIPASINYKTIYYSLGLVIICLLKQNLNNNEITNDEVVNLIEGTKLHKLLKGLLEIDISKRRLLYL